MTEGEYDEELSPEEIAEIEEEQRVQAAIDIQIGFFLNLLINEYDPDDVARVALDLQEKYHAQFMCKDCERDVVEIGEFFLVHDELEAQVDLMEGRLCVECFEKRLGRELSAFDFLSQMVIDGGMRYSELLKKRLIAGLAESLDN